MERDKYERYIAELEKRLSPGRLYHSREVAESAKHLAEKYGGDAEKAYEAGLLHDVLKEAKKDEIFALCDKYGVTLSRLEKSAHKLWHAKLGAEYIKHELGVTDEEIISAVRYHTTAKADMTKLELILFVADFVSADRDYPDVDVIRELSERSLEDAAVYGLSYTIRELCENNRPVHPDTLGAYNCLLLNKMEEEK